MFGQILAQFIRQYIQASVRRTFLAESSNSFAMLNSHQAMQTTWKGRMNKQLKGKAACYIRLRMVAWVANLIKIHYFQYSQIMMFFVFDKFNGQPAWYLICMPNGEPTVPIFIIGCECIHILEY